MCIELLSSENESQHDKTNKMTCAPSEDSDQPGHPTSLIKSLHCPHEESLGPEQPTKRITRTDQSRWMPSLI